MVRSLLAKSTPDKFAPEKLALDRLASLKSAPSKFDRENDAPDTSALLKFAPERLEFLKEEFFRLKLFMFEQEICSKAKPKMKTKIRRAETPLQAFAAFNELVEK